MAARAGGGDAHAALGARPRPGLGGAPHLGGGARRLRRLHRLRRWICDAPTHRGGHVAQFATSAPGGRWQCHTSWLTLRAGLGLASKGAPLPAAPVLYASNSERSDTTHDDGAHEVPLLHLPTLWDDGRAVLSAISLVCTGLSTELEILQGRPCCVLHTRLARHWLVLQCYYNRPA